MQPKVQKTKKQKQNEHKATEHHVWAAQFEILPKKLIKDSTKGSAKLLAL